MGKMILFVEDNATDEKLTLIAFRDCGVANQVVIVRDGAEALEWLFATGRFSTRDVSLQPTLVLLDLKLPRVSGLEVLRRIRSDERTRSLPVVVLTASSADEARVRSSELGANGFVRKPVEFEAFAAAVKEIGLRWLLLADASARVAS